jgi:hypothetical protein
MRSGIISGFLALALAGGCTSIGSGGSSSGGGGNQPVPPQEGQVAPLTPELKVVADDPGLLDGVSATRLSLMTVRDLVMRLQLPQLPADPTVVELKLLNPMGVQVQSRKFAFSANAATTQMPMAEMPHPMAVAPVRNIPGGVALDFSIPVGGTNLQRRPMPGLWHLVADAPGVHLDQIIELWAAQ